MSASVSSHLRPDLAVIAAHIEPGTRVLDVGCGDGALMAALLGSCLLYTSPSPRDS